MSAMDGVGVDLPGWCPLESLGSGRLRSAYAVLSREYCTLIVGLSVGLMGSQPDIMSWTWWGRGRVVTGPCPQPLMVAMIGCRSSADAGYCVEDVPQASLTLV